MSGSPRKLELRLFVINNPPETPPRESYNFREEPKNIPSEIYSKENMLKTKNNKENILKNGKSSKFDKNNNQRGAKSNKMLVKRGGERNSNNGKKNISLSSIVTRSKYGLNQRRYPKRLRRVVNYFEGNSDDCDDDSYIFCDVCQEEFYDGCTIHPLKNICDTEVSTRQKNKYRARLTIPYKYLVIQQSIIPKAGEGVFSNTHLPRGLRFGPYQGTSRNSKNGGGYYTWQIKKNGRLVNLVDGFDESRANWMRYVNCARNLEEQNLMAFVYRGHIFYRTVQSVPKDTEILVYYGHSYAKELNIDRKNFHYLYRRTKNKC